MDVVEADIAGQPMHEPRQVVEGAALEGRRLEIPLRVLAPIGVLELMLHIEQPDADRAGQEGDRQIADHQRPPADEEHDHRRDRRQRDIGAEHAEPGLVVAGRAAARDAMHQDELDGGPDDEEQQRVAIDPVDEPPQRRARAIFADGEGGDVAGAAPREIAGGGVMHRMVMAPEGIGGERQHADDAAQQVVRPARLEIGAVAAIMLDDEQPHEEGGGRQHEDERRPDLMGEAEEDPGQECQEGQGGAKQIENAAPAMRPRIGRDQPAPARPSAGRPGIERPGIGRLCVGGLGNGSGIFRGDRTRIGRKGRKAGAARRT